MSGGARYYTPAAEAKPPTCKKIEDISSIEFPAHELEQELQCPVCKTIPASPVTLKVCLHRMCKRCFERLYATKSRTVGKDRVDKLLCPICKAEIPSKRTAVSDPDYEALLRLFFNSAET